MFEYPVPKNLSNLEKVNISKWKKCTHASYITMGNIKYTVMWKCDKALVLIKNYKTELLFTVNAYLMHKMKILLCMCYITELMDNDTLARQLTSADLRHNYILVKRNKDIFTFFRHPFHTVSRRQILNLTWNFNCPIHWDQSPQFVQIFSIALEPLLENSILFSCIHWKYALSESIQVLTQYFKISRKGPATLKSKSDCD